ncbi:glycosyltransferase family 4 protein [Sphaerotilus sulfidivorans]|jgi:glycosyltransferase involved in cell wall biosynthesis|uniref:glycosyltransferase family 4 protein n=1 Tax=Sphaerotilus sp. FB-3 TaxID=2913396 RepID=UPI00203A4EF0|nr:glycosyltransferase family 4 protein [Sphaerotilus sp. FB-3]GKQ58247.1 glycosyl transferase [Sphaerotilus sp. FB-3]
MSTGQDRVLMVDMMSGANDYGLELCTALARRCDLTVVTVTNTSIAPDRVTRLLPIFPAFGAPMGKLTKLRHSLAAYVTLIREVLRHRHDIVHVQFFRFHLVDMLIYWLLSHWMDHLVYTAHNALPHESRTWHRLLYRRWYRRVSHVHVLSDYAKARIQEFSGLSPDKISVIHHGNYQALLERSGAKIDENATTSARPSSSTVTGLVFGQLREYKGVDLLISAARHLPTDSRLHFIVAGGGSPALFDSYAQQARDNGVGERFSFRCGHLEDSDLIAMITATDFSLFPYRHIYQSGALMLAMTCGTAIMAADLAGFREYTRNGEDALLCDCTSPETFAAALSRLENDPALRQHLQKASRDAATGRYSWEHIADSLIELYHARRS